MEPVRPAAARRRLLPGPGRDRAPRLEATDPSPRRGSLRQRRGGGEAGDGPGEGRRSRRPVEAVAAGRAAPGSAGRRRSGALGRARVVQVVGLQEDLGRRVARRGAAPVDRHVEHRPGRSPRVEAPAGRDPWQRRPPAGQPRAPAFEEGRGLRVGLGLRRRWAARGAGDSGTGCSRPGRPGSPPPGRSPRSRPAAASRRARIG